MESNSAVADTSKFEGASKSSNSNVPEDDGPPPLVSLHDTPPTPVPKTPVVPDVPNIPHQSTRKITKPTADDDPRYEVTSYDCKSKGSAPSVGAERAAVARDHEYIAKMSSPLAPVWLEKMGLEINNQQQMGTYTKEAPPDGANVLDCRWVYSEKLLSDGKVIDRKARLVAKGFNQIPGTDFDETYAPTLTKGSLLILLALAAVHDWEVRQLDVKAAFLHGDLKEEIYVNAPLAGFPTAVQGCPRMSGTAQNMTRDDPI